MCAFVGVLLKCFVFFRFLVHISFWTTGILKEFMSIFSGAPQMSFLPIPLIISSYNHRYTSHS